MAGDANYKVGYVVLLTGIALAITTAGVVAARDVEDAIIPFLQLIVTIPGAAIAWGIGRYACETKYAVWESLGPFLPAITYLACLAVLGGQHKQPANGLDEPIRATAIYMMAFFARSIFPQRNEQLSRFMAVCVFAVTIAMGVLVFLTTEGGHW